MRRLSFVRSPIPGLMVDQDDKRRQGGIGLARPLDLGKELQFWLGLGYKPTDRGREDLLHPRIGDGPGHQEILLEIVPEQEGL